MTFVQGRVALAHRFACGPVVEQVFAAGEEPVGTRPADERVGRVVGGWQVEVGRVRAVRRFSPRTSGPRAKRRRRRVSAAARASGVPAGFGTTSAPASASTPAPPARWSAPVPPTSRSLPRPPDRVSAPSPPWSASWPAAAEQRVVAGAAVEQGRAVSASARARRGRCRRRRGRSRGRRRGRRRSRPTAPLAVTSSWRPRAGVTTITSSPSVPRTISAVPPGLPRVGFKPRRDQSSGRRGGVGSG